MFYELNRVNYKLVTEVIYSFNYNFPLLYFKAYSYDNFKQLMIAEHHG